ncbi:MAG: hypothetical protein JXR94_16365, partial [Candidatus Hydrogenedentes bacterium]|nr:hypothetical protein [Candidatus Hydrogenedentota bacterium]
MSPRQTGISEAATVALGVALGLGFGELTVSVWASPACYARWYLLFPPVAVTATLVSLAYGVLWTASHWALPHRARNTPVLTVFWAVQIVLGYALAEACGWLNPVLVRSAPLPTALRLLGAGVASAAVAGALTWAVRRRVERVPLSRLLVCADVALAALAGAIWCIRGHAPLHAGLGAALLLVAVAGAGMLAFRVARPGWLLWTAVGLFCAVWAGSAYARVALPQLSGPIAVAPVPRPEA